MATGGHRRANWEIEVTPPYRGQGVGDGDFRLWIEGGQQVNIRDTNDVYVEMQDGETYAMWVANRFRATVEVDLNIDGRFLGSFLLDGSRALRIERPKDVAKKFTFFTARGSGSDSNHDLGLIRCLFKPRCREIVIKVKEQTRKIFAPESYTVLDLKKHIDRLEHIAPDQQNLWLVDGVISLRLEDEKTLSSYSIDDNSVIECHPPRCQRIDVRLPNKEIMLFTLFGDTVLDFKKRIHKIEPDLPPEKQHLFIHEKHAIELEDLHLLSHYMENEECKDDGVLLICNPPHPKKIGIYVKTVTGKTVSIDVYNNLDVSHLKELVKDKDYSVDEQKLIFAGKQLEDGRMLSDYNIEHNCTVHVVRRLRGGADAVRMCGPDVHWTRGSTRLTSVSDQTFPKRVDDDAEYDASAGEELTIKLVAKDTYSHSEPLEKTQNTEESKDMCILC